MEIKIASIDKEIYKQCENRWLGIAKPLYSLGEMEKMVNLIGAIRRDVNAPCSKRVAIIMCADNGVVKEGISQTDQSITKIVADNLVKGKSSLNILSRNQKLDVRAVNIGMLYEPEEAAVINKCVRKGTGNIACEKAMSTKEVYEAINIGIEQVKEVVEAGYDLIITGEMGIGNTTTTSACAAVLLDRPVEEVTGKGAGLSEEGLKHKIEVIKKAIELHKPDKDDPIDVLSKVGGLDIAGMTGIFLGAAIYGRPVVIDGLISSIAALFAKMINPLAAEYMIASHVSREPAGAIIMDKLSLNPVINAGLALGEGTGAAFLLPMLDMVYNMYYENVTFKDINMEAYKKL